MDGSLELGEEELSGLNHKDARRMLYIWRRAGKMLVERSVALSVGGKDR